MLSLASTQLAQASLSFVIEDLDGNTSFNNVQQGDTYTLMVYAMIKNSNSTPSASDGLTSAIRLGSP